MMRMIIMSKVLPSDDEIWSLGDNHKLLQVLADCRAAYWLQNTQGHRVLQRGQFLETLYSFPPLPFLYYRKYLHN